MKVFCRRVSFIRLYIRTVWSITRSFPSLFLIPVMSITIHLHIPFFIPWVIRINSSYHPIVSIISSSWLLQVLISLPSLIIFFSTGRLESQKVEDMVVSEASSLSHNIHSEPGSLQKQPPHRQGYIYHPVFRQVLPLATKLYWLYEDNLSWHSRFRP